MKVAVVGNCQARPVASFLGAMAPSLVLLPDTVIHLSNAGKAEAELANLDQADMIFSQLISDDYPAAHLATSRLKERYQDKLITWPNLFFNGNCAELAYITHAGGRLNGPLDAYHNRFLFDAWCDGVPVGDARARLAELYREHANTIRCSVQTSLETLRQRDGECDVSMLDVIEANWQKRRLFFTFNHPSNDLLLPLVRRMLEHANIDVSINLSPAYVQEPLSLIVVPTHTELADVLELDYDTVESGKGVDVQIEGAKVTSGASRLYSSTDLIHRFYDVYNAAAPDVASCRFTPAYSPSSRQIDKAA